MLSAAAAEKCRNIANKLQNYFPHTRNKAQHEISRIIFTANQGLLDDSYPVPILSPASQVSLPPFLPLLLVQKMQS
jgi:hypothetical protein